MWVANGTTDSRPSLSPAAFAARTIAAKRADHSGSRAASSARIPPGLPESTVGDRYTGRAVRRSGMRAFAVHVDEQHLGALILGQRARQFMRERSSRGPRSSRAHEHDRRRACSIVTGHDAVESVREHGRQAIRRCARAVQGAGRAPRAAARRCRHRRRCRRQRNRSAPVRNETSPMTAGGLRCAMVSTRPSWRVRTAT